MSSSKKNGTADQTAIVGDQAQLAASWFQMLAKWNWELAALYQKRMREWVSIPHSLSKCASPGDLAAAQREFSETWLADYRGAAEKLGRAIGANEASGHQEYAARLLKAQDDARDILDQAKAQAQRIVEEAERRGAEALKAGGQSKAA